MQVQCILVVEDGASLLMYLAAGLEEPQNAAVTVAALSRRVSFNGDFADFAVLVLHSESILVDAISELCR